MKEYMGVVLFFIVAVALFIYTWRFQQLEKSNALLKKNISQVEQLYDEMQERVDAIRKYRHDLQKHIRIVEQFLEESRQLHPESGTEFSALYETIQEMGEDIIQTRTKYCDDEVVDAICRIKAEECASENIPFLADIESDKEDLTGFDPYHITGILMNLLDNALEAERKLPSDDRKGILLQIGKTSNGISILAENDIPQDFLPDFKTTKRNVEKHGLGLPIAREYSQMYGGEITIHVDTEMCRCRVGTVLCKK